MAIYTAYNPDEPITIIDALVMPPSVKNGLKAPTLMLAFAYPDGTRRARYLHELSADGGLPEIAQAVAAVSSDPDVLDMLA